MSDEPQIFAYVPTGRRVDTGEARETVFSVGGLTPADDHRLKVARQYFTEVRAEDFDQQRKDWVDRATGEHYRLVGFDPTLSEHPADTGVTSFFITGDGYLGYLRPLGSQGRSKTVVMGEVGGVEGMSGERKFVHMSDWLAATRAGADAGVRPVPEGRFKPVGVPTPPVPAHYPVSFSLFQKEASARERSRQVDHVLAKAGVTPRHRAQVPGQRLVR
jgi:hypothetical protein